MISLFDSVKERLVTSFPTKVKLIIHPKLRIPRTWPHEELVEVSASFGGDDFLTSMLEIFTKRWQTMDLISMMRELKRSLEEKRLEDRGSPFFYKWRRNVNIYYKENLSCLVRFIMHEEPID